jgi:hypothetical protein
MKIEDAFVRQYPTAAKHQADQLRRKTNLHLLRLSSDVSGRFDHALSSIMMVIQF